MAANEMDSVLLSVKKMIGLTSDYTAFDTDIIIHINTVFEELNQMGVGPEEGFSISDSSTEWSEYFTYGKTSEMVKSYMYLKVRMLFDPPSSGTLAQAYNANLDEYRWRLLIFADELRLEREKASK